MGEGEGGGSEPSENEDDELKVGLGSRTTIFLADFAVADMFKVLGDK